MSRDGSRVVGALFAAAAVLVVGVWIMTVIGADDSDGGFGPSRACGGEVVDGWLTFAREVDLAEVIEGVDRPEDWYWMWVLVDAHDERGKLGEGETKLVLGQGSWERPGQLPVEISVELDRAQEGELECRARAVLQDPDRCFRWRCTSPR